jgi:PAP_fibrillin
MMESPSILPLVLLLLLMLNICVQESLAFQNLFSPPQWKLASTAAYPLAELQQRQITGTVWGLNLLGVSLVGEEAQPDPNRPNSRIDFVFDEGNFMLAETFEVPYPVPFRSPWFRDWVKGWIDIAYLSNRIRISRGNKGTTFVLLKEVEEKETTNKNKL